MEEIREAEAAAAWAASQSAQELRRRGLMSLYILIVALALTVFVWYGRLRWRARRADRRARRGASNYNRNLYHFRDETAGVPGFYITGSSQRDEADEEHLILHDVEIS